MFSTRSTLPVLKHLRERYGDRLYGRYGFADALHPTDDWINPDVIGIDLGITLLSIENLRTRNVWRWFMANPEIQTAMRQAGLGPMPGGPQQFGVPPDARYELVAAPDEAEDKAARAARASWSALTSRFEAHTFEAPGGITLPYRLLRPREHPPQEGAPLVLVLHGSGEIGTDNRAQLTPLALAWAREKREIGYDPFVVVPQMPARSAEYSGPASGDVRTSQGTALVPATLALLDDLVARHPIDGSRISVVGFSMGASTAWNLLHERPGFFAAAIPVAGVPRADQAKSPGATRIWVIHGNRDETNPIRHDRRAFVPLVDAGAHIRFHEIDRLAHDVPPGLLVSGAFARFLRGGQPP